MLQIIRLLLPALLPSWRFFAEIAPSPRIQYSLLSTNEATPISWLEFQPRPQKLSMWQNFRRLFWNPEWNESLFMVSCAERILENHTLHSESEIMARIIADMNRRSFAYQTTPYIQFRLLLIHRHGAELLQEVCFRSAVRLIDDTQVS